MIESSLTKLIFKAAVALKSKPRIRYFMCVVSGIILVASGLFLVSLGIPDFWSLYLTKQSQLLLNKVLPYIVGISFIGFLISGLSYFNIDITDKVEQQLDILKNEREKIERELEVDHDIFKTIKLNLNQINEYFIINKSQARSTFRFSVFVITLGFITIISGIWIYYVNPSSYSITVITTITGFLCEFIGAINIYIYIKSLKQLNYFYEKLDKMQYIMLSIRLCEEIGEPVKTIEIKEKIIAALINSSTKDSINKEIFFDK